MTWPFENDTSAITKKLAQRSFKANKLLNTCITNTVIRRHDYALLEAAGMTKVQIYQTQSAENRIYFFGSLIGSCVVGIPLGFLLCNKIAEIPGLSYISYRFPWPFLPALSFFPTLP